MIYPMRDGIYYFMKTLDARFFVPKRYFHLPSAIPYLPMLRMVPYGLRHQTPMPYIHESELKAGFYFMEYVH